MAESMDFQELQGYPLTELSASEVDATEILARSRVAHQKDGQGLYVEPRRWAMTLQQLLSLKRLVEFFYRGCIGGIQSKSMADIVEYFIKPQTSGTGMGYALFVNKDAPIAADVMISHIWQESFVEFCIYLAHEEHAIECDGIWICALALFQCEDGSGPSIPAQIGPAILESPFAQVISKARIMLVVQTPTVARGYDKATVYDRLWCVLEMSEAIRCGIPVKLLGSVVLDTLGDFEPKRARCGNPNLPPNDDELAIRAAIDAMPMDDRGNDGWTQIKKRIGRMILSLAAEQYDVKSTCHPRESTCDAFEIDIAASLYGQNEAMRRSKRFITYSVSLLSIPVAAILWLLLHAMWTEENMTLPGGDQMDTYRTPKNITPWLRISGPFVRSFPIADIKWAPGGDVLLSVDGEYKRVQVARGPSTSTSGVQVVKAEIYRESVFPNKQPAWPTTVVANTSKFNIFFGVALSPDGNECAVVSRRVRDIVNRGLLAVSVQILQVNPAKKDGDYVMPLPTISHVTLPPSLDATDTLWFSAIVWTASGDILIGMGSRGQQHARLWRIRSDNRSAVEPFPWQPTMHDDKSMSVIRSLAVSSSSILAVSIEVISAPNYIRSHNAINIVDADDVSAKFEHGHDQPVAMLAWAPGSRTLAACDSHSCWLWTRTGRSTWAKFGKPLRGAIAAWSPDGGMLAIGSGDTTIQLWSTHSQYPYQWKQVARPLVGHEDRITCLAWSQDSKLLASGSTDGSILVWSHEVDKQMPSKGYPETPR